MSKKISYTVIDETTLELQENASVGDRINLKDSIKIDTNFISNEIKKFYENQKQIAIEQEVTKQKQNFEALKKAEINQAIEKYKLDHSDQVHKMEKDFQEQILKKEFELKKLQNDFNSIKEKNNEITNLAIEKTKNELTKQHNEEVHKLNEQILQLKRMEGFKNSKNVGENLEQWCIEEFIKFENAGAFTTAEFRKDNETTNGTKADFIFTVFDEKMKELTSVCLEMKSETGMSKTSRKNEDFFEKLDKDRVNKGCEYAILVSELEPNHNFIWYQARDYEKMYVIRPAYLFQFLSLIYNVSKKYAEVNDMICQKIEEMSNDDKFEILDRVEELRAYILDNAIHRLIDSTEEILGSTALIIKNAEKIKKTCERKLIALINEIAEEVHDFDFEDKEIKPLNKKTGDNNYSPAFFKKNKN